MSDTELRELERQARSGDAGALNKLQLLRDRFGLTSADAEYYQKYYQICEDFINRKISLYVAQGGTSWQVKDYFSGTPANKEWVAQNEPDVVEQIKNSRLYQLNEEYKYLVGSKTLRYTVLASILANASEDGWAKSDICW